MSCHKSLSFLWRYHHDRVLYLRQAILLFLIFLQNCSRPSAVLIVLGQADLLEEHFRFSKEYIVRKRTG